MEGQQGITGDRKRREGRYIVFNVNTDSSISLASTRMDTTLWHHRLGYISEKGMQILHKKNCF